MKKIIKSLQLRVGEWLCAYDIHAWEKEPKRENLELIKWGRDFSIFTQGTQKGVLECTRKGCLAKRTVSRTGFTSMFGSGISSDWEKSK
jgi:hypothetical protein